jgi:long-chain acyl-CoA synthetase
MLSEEAREEINNGGKEAIEKELAELLNRVNGLLQSSEQLAFVAVIKDEWMPENGFLTPTLKIKRTKLEKAYGSLFDGWYEEKKPVLWQD